MLLVTHYAQNYTGIIGWSLLKTQQLTLIAKITIAQKPQFHIALLYSYAKYSIVGLNIMWLYHFLIY